jgi:hypothetical protein
MNCLINSAEQKHILDLEGRSYLISTARPLTKTILLKDITN